MGTDKLLEVIGKAESNGSYDYSYGSKNKVKLTDKTIGEVLDHQGQMKKKGSPSTAVGKYQFLQSTLKGLTKELGLNGTEKFTEKLQDKLANALLNRRGYQKFLAGNITREDFVKRLSQEFAGLPGMNGKSYYHGDGLNASNVPLSELLSALGGE
jgi:muramidase (phage lysozyme)